MNYVVAVDNRQAYKSINRLIYEGKAEMLKTVIALLVVSLIVLLLMSLFISDVTLINILGIWIILNQALETVYIARSTAIRTRLGNINYIMYRLRKMIPLPFTSPVISTCNNLYNACVTDMKNRYNKYNHQWHKLDHKYMGNKRNIIDEYWQSKGLTDTQIKKSTECVRFNCKAPITSELEKDYAFTAESILPSDFPLLSKSIKWGLSDLSDEMHVKSIYKRICSAKYRIDLTCTKEMIKAMQYISDKLPKEIISLDDSIIRALATDGTAGQFSKQSAYEDMWKESRSEEAALIWKDIVKEVLYGVYLTNKMPEQIVAYMLYRKREALEKDDNDNLKITRIMNAPNLVARICDSVCFSSFNDAIVKIRQQGIPSIGMNIFVELKMVMYYDPRRLFIEVDFAEYDGSQHPCQSFAVAFGRIKYMKRNGQHEQQIAYMGARYERHMNRKVRSTFGIEYDVIGQQASGDITTTDDNTSKTAYGIMMICEALRKNGMIQYNKNNKYIYNIVDGDNITAEATGDDIGIAVIPVVEQWSDDKVYKIIDQEVAKMGWKVKPGSYKASPMLQDGVNQYLSHNIERRSVWSQYCDIEITTALLTRPRERAYGKWKIAAELSKNLTKMDKAKLSSKYLTLIMTSVGMPEIMMASLIMLYKLRSASMTYGQSYSWAGVTARTIDDIDLNYMLELQLQCRIRKRIDWVEIKADEKEMINAMNIYLNEIIDDDIDKKILPENINRNSLVIKDNRWNYRAMKDQIVAMIREMDRRSYITKPIQTESWWTEREKILTEQNQVTITGFINKCEHQTTDLKIENKGIYNIKVKCEECYNNDIEKYYESINICVKTSKGGEVVDGINYSNEKEAEVL